MASNGKELVIKPMDQFIVEPLFGYTKQGADDLPFYVVTNVTLWMFLALIGIIIVFIFATRNKEIIPGRAQSIAELAYGFIYQMVEDITGKEGLRYFPYIITLFVFIVFSNFLGLIPTAFTTTSHIAVTATMALMVFVFVTLLGIIKNGFGFLSLFWIASAPLILRPILAIIEVISYFVRPVSHSIRLAGNMMAGHAVIKVFAGFAGILGVGAIAPIVAITAVYALEMLVSFIQAYVFAILTCVYLKDALHPQH